RPRHVQLRREVARNRALGGAISRLLIAVNGYHVARKGPMASAFVPLPSHTSGEPPTRARLCWSIRSNPKRLLPGPVGGASAPVPSTETPVAPEMSAPIDPEGADFERRELPPLQAAPIKPTPMASRNCLRVGCKPGPGPCRGHQLPSANDPTLATRDAGPASTGPPETPQKPERGD